MIITLFQVPQNLDPAEAYRRGDLAQCLSVCQPATPKSPSQPDPKTEPAPPSSPMYLAGALCPRFGRGPGLRQSAGQLQHF
eukprot:6859948-Pyramimonas_sp.AAC.1